ncbi:enoyl-CoA hydratase/isomerase family protein [Rhizobium sp. NZLR11]|uniref:enoyl-CoA hydratase/isomerase family protein n=1 Tax=Rhizobium sp. NZLR11 TaxID=2731098 RepID=UPI001C83259C|nr:enoyl-CoA hydratase-related protein [Rhizobium sp. NZLR11]MBX5210474.1 enoyl-CoA hydratase/isomerase family protein [Rhizobium sp. NZLR11]
MSSISDTYQNIGFALQNRVMTVSLNRPERLNAISHELHEELGRVFIDLAKDDGVDVIILRGNGKAFSAGGDLKGMHAHMLEVGSPGHYMSFSTAKRIVYSLLELEKPIIAQVHGACYGLGATIALLCDVVFMAESATIGDPHVGAGVVAGDGGAIIWPQLVGYARAKEFLMTGNVLSASHAERIGLVNHMVADADLDATVRAFAAQLAEGSQDAIRWTKVSVNIGLRQLAHSILDASLAYELVTMRSADHADAITAFSNKQKPTFRRKV